LREAAMELPIQIASACGLVTPFFSTEGIRDFAGATRCDLDAYGRFARAMLDRGIYPPASQFEAWFVSLTHDEAAIDRTCEAAADAFALAFA
jgi:glutamate-1-semialdehyde 2,1-aminomutase